jgi:hypothetical protein
MMRALDSVGGESRGSVSMEMGDKGMLCSKLKIVDASRLG